MRSFHTKIWYEFFACFFLMLVEANNPSVRLRPRPIPLFCLSFLVWRMFYSIISSTMSSTLQTCQSRGPLPLCQIVPQDIVMKNLKVSCACVPVLVFACVCVCACVRATSICVRENLRLHFLIFVCVCACNREGTSHTSSKVDGRLE